MPFGISKPIANDDGDQYDISCIEHNYPGMNGIQVTLYLLCSNWYVQMIVPWEIFGNARDSDKIEAFEEILKYGPTVSLTSGNEIVRKLVPTFERLEEEFNKKTKKSLWDDKIGCD